MSVALLARAGVLDRAAIERTVEQVAALQRPDGSIPWFHGDKTDPWDHVESAMALTAAGRPAAAAEAYRWLADRQNCDGSWYANYADTAEGAAEAADKTKDANFTAYLAVGAYHHLVATGDRDLAGDLWPSVRRAIEFVLELQRPDGAIRWNPETDEALLTGSSSMYQALRCAVALAERVGGVSGRRVAGAWTQAAVRLGEVVVAAASDEAPEVFAPKDRYSMDWYYPVLGTALRGEAGHARIDGDWDRFVVPGLGARCVADRPWVTGGETFELCIALWALGRAEQARRVLTDVQHLRDRDGLYWTGYVYADKAVWPEEKTSWTAGSLLLALAVLGGEPASRTVFGGGRLPAALPARASVLTA
ncbi:prenyltransferase [Actinospica durhamensis]|uniref:Prenyltransferase n=1 Tax=Actinospica durhamensis TaxID=1508375 RepID=A0A941EN87_9ACTN|nr:prenyltransferase [Actinospica durhamensis]MBR7834376.1 prenyltransferase [Actinospica durhamensis]